MHSLIILFFVFSSFQVEAKKNWCQVDMDFAEAYMQARQNYYLKIKDARSKGYSGSSGYLRAKENKHVWEQLSLKDQVQQIFPDQDVIFDVKESGKILVYPKDAVLNNPGKAIVFDSSGDYFRVVKTEVRDGKIVDKNSFGSYFGKNGQEIARPKGLSEEEWKDYFLKHSHFLANP